MKKTKVFLDVIAVLALCVLTFIKCTSEDEESVQPRKPGKVPTLFTVNGKDSYQIEYDNQLRIVCVKDVNDSNTKVEYTYNELGDIAKVVYNRYNTKQVAVYTYTGDTKVEETVWQYPTDNMHENRWLYTAILQLNAYKQVVEEKISWAPSIDGAGNRFTYEYDVKGNITSSQIFWGDSKRSETGYVYNGKHNAFSNVTSSLILNVAFFPFSFINQSNCCVKEKDYSSIDNYSVGNYYEYTYDEDDYPVEIRKNYSSEFIPGPTTVNITYTVF